jgi:predicted acyl esterase
VQLRYSVESNARYITTNFPKFKVATTPLVTFSPSMLFDEIVVSQGDLQPVDSPRSQWTGLSPETLTLSAGHVKEPRQRAFPADTLFERDAIIPLRDGYFLRADIFRPTGIDHDLVPALVVWSPYGKTGSGLFTPMLIIVEC